MIKQGMFSSSIGDAPVSNAVAISTTASPNVTAYPWTQTGYGTKYTDSVDPPGGTDTRALTFHRDKSVMFISYSASPFFTAYAFSAGFGTRYATASVGAIVGVVDIAMSRLLDGVYVSSGVSSNTGGAQAYQWSNSTGFGTKSSAPVGLGADLIYQIAASTATDVVIYGMSTNRFWATTWTSATGFGTRFSNPAAPLAGAHVGCIMTPQNDAVVGNNLTASPFMSGFQWSDTTGFGTMFAAPSSIPGVMNSTYGSKAAMHPKGTAVAVISAASPFTNAYAFSSATGFGTKYANPGTLLTGSAGMGCPFSDDGLAITYGNSVSPYTHTYAFSEATGFGTKFANPTTVGGAGSAATTAAFN